MNERIELSHKGLNETISNFGAELKSLKETLQSHVKAEEVYQRRVDDHLNDSRDAITNLSKLTVDDIQSLKEVAQGYAGMSAARKMIVGLAGIVVAIGTIIMGLTHLIRSIK